MKVIALICFTCILSSCDANLPEVNRNETHSTHSNADSNATQVDDADNGILKSSIDVFGRRFIEIIESNKHQNEQLTGDEFVKHSYEAFALDLKKTTLDLLRAILPVALPLFNNININDECINSLVVLMNGIKEQKDWALKSKFILFSL